MNRDSAAGNVKVTYAMGRNRCADWQPLLGAGFPADRPAYDTPLTWAELALHRHSRA